MALAVWVLLEAWQVVSWIFIAVLFAIALMPAVDFLERAALLQRPVASPWCAAAALVVVGLLAWAVVPPLVSQTTELIQAIPGAIDDITAGRGPLGFLQSDYGLADRAREYLDGRTGERLLGFTLAGDRGAARHPHGHRRHGDDLLPRLLPPARGASLGGGRRSTWCRPPSRPRWERVFAGITRTIRGYVTGNLLISLIAGIVAYVTLMAVGVPYALPLAVLVAVLDLVPLVGATLATVAGRRPSRSARAICARASSWWRSSSSTSSSRTTCCSP